MTPEEARKLVGKRILHGERLLGSHKYSLIEYKILEVSPSGEYAKVIYESGRREWKCTEGLQLLEMLETGGEHNW